MQCRAGGIESLAADRFYFDQRLVTFDRGLSLEQRGLRAGQISLRLGQRGLERRRIDLEQHCAGFHIGTFLEVAAQHDAGHPGANLRHTHRFDTAGQFVNDRERFGVDGNGFHLFGRFRCSVILLLFLLAPGQTQRCQQGYCRHDTPIAETTHHSPGRSHQMLKPRMIYFVRK